MPPKSPYKFTRPQHEYLKSHLELYMVALQAEDTVKEITSTINSVYEALVKEFHLGDHDKEAIQMVRYTIELCNTGRYIDSSFSTTVTYDVVQLQGTTHPEEDANRGHVACLWLRYLSS